MQVHDNNDNYTGLIYSKTFFMYYTLSHFSRCSFDDDINLKLQTSDTTDRPRIGQCLSYFIFCIHVKQPLPPGDNPIAVSKYYYILYILFVSVVCIVVFTLDAGLLVRSQYSEGPATGHLDTGFSRFPCVYKQTLRWFPSCHYMLLMQPSRLKFISNQFHILYTCKITTATG